MTFFQKPPRLSNLYLQDFALQTQLNRYLPLEMKQKATVFLEELGALCATTFQDWAMRAEACPPKHVPYDAWGRRIDQIQTSEAWEWFKEWSPRGEIVSSGYNSQWKEKARVVQTALLYLFSASSATYSCPLAMSDAAVKVLNHFAPMSLKERLVPRLLSQDPKEAITSGQWMTERTGGSDVSQTQTTARFVERVGEEERYTLHGVKWFTSATTAEMALTLAKIDGDSALTLFCVELERDTEGLLKGILINRLKDKLGTRALPTAELTLDGVFATRIGPVGRGVASISSMLNVTRYYNAVASASSMGLSTQWVKDYAQKRVAFGKPVAEHVLHQQVIDELEATAAASLALCMQVADWFFKEDDAALRALIPIAKLLLGKQAVWHASETLESFGGAGYIEDTGLPRILRDAQVFPIWEGTTNVLSLDVLRAEKKQGALSALLQNMGNRIEVSSHPVLKEEHASLVGLLRTLRDKGDVEQEKHARKVAMRTGKLMQALLLFESIPHAVVGDTRAETRFEVFVESGI